MECNAAARLASLLDSAMDAIISIDEAQRVVLYNRAAEQVFGWPAEQVMGRGLDLLLPQRFRAVHRQHIERFAHTGVTTRRIGTGMVLVGLRANGQEFPMEASISQLRTDEGRRFTVILRDVTERVRAHEELVAFAADAAQAREQEKARIARELHDELAQSLTILKMDIHWLRTEGHGQPHAVPARLVAMEALVDASTASTRRIASDLRPPVLDDLGLVPALQWLVQNFRQRAEIDCELEIDEQLELPEPAATTVFRIIQESLANVRKHAQAHHVRIQVRLGREGLVLRVRDDGVGFSPDGGRKPNSLGLLGLRERALLLGGRVDIASAPGQGTTVEVRLPAPPPPQGARP